ncbi:hypothetical protein PENSPDRAFT_760055 [Peniophora sp. CONT]|nr:hypothetical protein PENSPDRAFT_760055 [Peniophora sp. CONT]
MPKDTNNPARPQLSVHTMNNPYPIYHTSTSPDTAGTASPDQESSAAHKALLLFKKTMTLEEAELDAKKLASDSRRSIAEGTPRLFTLPYDELQLAQRSGKATSGLFTVTDGIIKLDDSASDGDVYRVPSSEQRRRKEDAAGRVDQYMQLAEGHKVHRHWAKTIGQLVAYHMFHQKRSRSVGFRIELPHGYSLWHHIDGTVSDEDNARKDPYLYGSITHGTGKTPFRSPAEFAPHFMWLMLGRPEGECKCQYCTHRPQDEVSAELFGYLSKSELQGPQPIASGSGQQSVVEKKKPKGRRLKPVDKPIVAKDYTKGL